MKKTAFAFTFAALCLASTVRADDCALVSLRVGKEKQLRQFALEFDSGSAPATVENFKKLSRKGFYKGCAIHRSFPHRLVQMGDPLSKKAKCSRSVAMPGTSNHERGYAGDLNKCNTFNVDRVS